LPADPAGDQPGAAGAVVPASVLPIVPVGPGFYPAIVLSFMAAASALLVVQDVIKHRAPAEAGVGDAPRRNYRWS